MKSDRFLYAVEGTVLAFLIAFGGCSCLITAFAIPVSPEQIAFLCAGGAFVAAVCFSFRQWVPLTCLLALAAGYLFRGGRGGQAVAALLHHISGFYDRAYHWGVFFWEKAMPETAALTLALGLIGGFLALVVSSVVCCHRWAGFALLPALLPLTACLVVTDSVPGEISLFILLLGAILLLLTQTLRRKKPLDAARLTALLILPVALFLAALFWAIPREGYVFSGQQYADQALDVLLSWGQSVWEDSEIPDVPSNLTPLPNRENQVNLTQVGPQWNLRVQIMEVTAAIDGPLYLRGTSYDTYDGTSWSDTGAEELPELWPDPAALSPLGQVAVRTRSALPIRYFCYYSTLDNWAAQIEHGEIKNADGLTEYRFDMGTFIPDSAAFRGLQPENYLALPPETRRWAETVLAETGSDAESIAHFVRSSARYDLSTGRMPAEQTDFARWFLENSDTGYCIHFATAATVLLRAAGIPARYVTGYMVQAKAGEPVRVLAENAHAWVEYLSPETGVWTVLEATPATAQEAPTEPAAQEPVKPSENNISTRPDTTFPDTPHPTGQTAETQHPGSTDPTAAPEAAANSPRSLTWLYCSLYLGLLVAFVAGQRQLRIFLRRQRRTKGTPNTQALVRWQEAVSLARLLKEKPPADLNALAQKAKYSQYCLTGEELAQFDDYISETKNQLRSRPFLRRLVDKFIFAAY